MSITEKKARSIFCPYYINIDRLIDISASLSDGYSEYEDIEVSKVESNSKNKSFSGKHSSKFFSLGFEGEVSSGVDSAETKKVKRIHTQASLLNSTVKTLQDIEKLRNLNSPFFNNSGERQPLFECGDIVTFAGKLEQNEYGIAELTTYGTEANKVNIVKKAILVIPLLILLGGILLGVIKYIHILDIICLGISSIFLIECILCIYLLFLGNISSNKTKRYKAIKKSEKKNTNMHKAQISFDTSAFWDKTNAIFVDALVNSNKQNTFVKIDTQFIFLCYLYDDYFYQSDMKDILGRTFDCLAIIKDIERSFVEIEVVAIYIYK